MYQLCISDWLDQGREWRVHRQVLDEIAADRIKEMMAEDDETWAECKPDIEEEGD